MNTKSFWFPAFRKVVPAEFEEWLEGLAQEGWNVENLGLFGAFRIKFRKTEPRKYRYVFDLNVLPKEDYTQTYRQFGWEFAGRMSNCFVWRKEYAGIRPESFTDNESLVRRNKQLRNIFIAVSVLIFIAIGFLITGGVVMNLYGKSTESLALIPALVFFSAFSVYFRWVIRKINKNLDR